MERISYSENDTKRYGEELARTLAPGDVVLLYGDLGMGKTVFARALIRALCENPRQEVPSPTFTLVQTYDAPVAPLWHFDLYRLTGPEEIHELGWEEARAGGIALVEWPERLRGILPRRRIEIAFTQGQKPDARIIRETRHD